MLAECLCGDKSAKGEGILTPLDVVVAGTGNRTQIEGGSHGDS